MSKPERSPKCELCEEAWNRQLDGEEAILAPDLEAHRSVCERCQALSRGCEAIKSYSGPALASPIEGFADRVLRRIGTPQPTASRSRRRYFAGILAIAAAWVVGIYLGTTRQMVSTVPEVPRNAPNADRQMLAQAARQWKEIGSDMASATLRAAETPLDLPGKIIPFKPIIDSDALNGLEPISLAFAHVGESAYESFEPLRKTAEYGVKEWFKSVSQPH